MTRLTDLPPEILRQIVKHVAYNIDLYSLSQTNHRFYSLASEELNHHLRQVFESHLKHPESDILHWASANGNVACVRRLLQAGIPPAPPIIPGWHPIILAAKNGHVDVVRTFLDHGVNPNPPTGFHTRPNFGNPLTFAIEQGHEAVVRLLIEHGVDLEFSRQKMEIQQPLSLATGRRHPALVKLLLEHGCNPLTPDYRPYAYIEKSAWKAASRASPDIVQMFVDHGIRPDFSDPGYPYHDSLMDVLKRGDMPLVKFLFDQGARFRMPTYPSYEAVFGPVQDGDVLFHIGWAVGRFPDYAAFLLEKINVDNILEEANPRANVHIMLGATCGGGDDLVKRLLNIDWVANYPTVDVEGWKDHLGSCLNSAIRNGHVNLVKLFLDHGADPCGTRRNKKGRKGIYPPIFAAAQNEYPEIVELLLDRGADPFVTYSCTLLEKILSSCKDSEARLKIIQLLVERNVLVPKDGDSSDIIVTAVSGGADIFKLILQHMDVQLQPGNSLHEEAFANAVEKGDTIIMEMFLKAGFDPNTRSDLRRESFLTLAAKAGAGEPAVDLLLEYGADIEWQHGEKNLTPLYMVRLSGNAVSQAKSVRLLLKKGADPFCLCRCGDDLLLKAAKGNELPTIKALLEHFDEGNMPFSEVKPMIEAAAGTTRNKKVAECLWRWYWPRVYPCPEAIIQTHKRS